jgi:hypothetical protein
MVRLMSLDHGLRVYAEGHRFLSAIISDNPRASASKRFFFFPLNGPPFGLRLQR